jgi:hypothetical protein
MIAYAKKKDINILLSTNLSIKLTDDYIDRLVLSGLDRMLVSLGRRDAGVVFESTGKEEISRSSERTLDGLQHAKQRLNSTTRESSWQFLVFRHNEHEIEQARAFAQRVGRGRVHRRRRGNARGTVQRGFRTFDDPGIQRLPSGSPVTERSRATVYQATAPVPGSTAFSFLIQTVRSRPAVPSHPRKFDFGEYHNGDFFSVWNNEKFRRARRMFSSKPNKPRSEPRPLTTEQKTSISKRVDGMALRVVSNLGDDKLICHQCPIPFLQNYTESDHRGSRGDATPRR